MRFEASTHCKRWIFESMTVLAEKRSTLHAAFAEKLVKAHPELAAEILSEDDERLILTYYEAKIQEVQGLFSPRFPNRVQVSLA